MDAESCGDTVHDINMLTVIASESYKGFVADLQSDIKTVLYDRPTTATSEYFNGKYVKVDGTPTLIDKNIADTIEFYLISNGYVDMKRKVTDKYRTDVKMGTVAPLPEEIQPMGDIARCSVGKSNEYYNEDLLYKLFGINAELLIDHAWGWEQCTIAEVKQYKPESNSVGSGQVLHCPYDFEKARLVVREMIDLLVLDLVDKGLVTDQIVLTVGYDIENLSDPVRRKAYKGQITTDRYGRQVPKHAHGTANIGRYTSSTRLVTDAVLELYDRIVDKSLLVRRLNISANHVIFEADVPKENKVEQLDLFTDYAALEKEKEKEDAALEREKKMQQAVLTIKKKFGKNAILKGMNLQEGATAKDRNAQIGGHKA